MNRREEKAGRNLVFIEFVVMNRDNVIPRRRKQFVHLSRTSKCFTGREITSLAIGQLNHNVAGVTTVPVALIEKEPFKRTYRRGHTTRMTSITATDSRLVTYTAAELCVLIRLR